MYHLQELSICVLTFAVVLLRTTSSADLSSDRHMARNMRDINIYAGNICSYNQNANCCGEIGQFSVQCVNTGGIANNVGQLVNVQNIQLPADICGSECSAGSTCFAVIQPDSAGEFTSTPFCCTKATRDQIFTCSNGDTETQVNCVNYTGNDTINNDNSVAKGVCCSSNCFA